MFTQTSNFVEGVDFAFALIFGISLFFLIGITAVMIYFVIRYRKNKHPHAVQIPNNNALEITWTAIPLVIVLIMFYYGYMAFLPMRTPPKDAMIVKTTARMWSWDFEYANGKHSQELLVPINKATKLEMTSKDVIHGMFIPAFRLKEDVIPGTQTFIWFEPKDTGVFEVFCSAYCGLAHSAMETKVRVISQNEFDAWLAKAPEVKIDAEAGLVIIKKNACTTCHSLDGSKLLGPSFKGLYNSKRIVIVNNNEQEITANEEYISNSILKPNDAIVKNFNKGIMQSYEGTLNKNEIQSIIEYFKNIK